MCLPITGGPNQPAEVEGAAAAANAVATQAAVPSDATATTETPFVGGLESGCSCVRTSGRRQRLVGRNIVIGMYKQCFYLNRYFGFYIMRLFIFLKCVLSTNMYINMYVYKEMHEFHIHTLPPTV